MTDDVPLSTIEELAPVEYSVRPLIEALVVFAIVLLATFSTVYFIYFHAIEAQKGEIRQGLIRTANIIATQIDPELHRQFDDPAEEHSAEYIEAEARLSAVRYSDPTIAFVWTAILSDDKVRFVLDPTPAPAPGAKDDRVALLEEFPDPSPELLRALRKQETVASEAPYQDKWGSFVSAYVPLRDADGGFVAIVGVDIDASEYFRRLEPIERATFRALATAFAIACGASFAVWFLRRYIGALNRRRIALFDELRRRLAARRARSSDAGPGVAGGERR